MQDEIRKSNDGENAPSWIYLFPKSCRRVLLTRYKAVKNSTRVMSTGDELRVFLASIFAEKFSKISLFRAFEGF